MVFVEEGQWREGECVRKRERREDDKKYMHTIADSWSRELEMQQLTTGAGRYANAEDVAARQQITFTTFAIHIFAR